MDRQGAHAAVVAALPRLRAFAISLTGKSDQADDLVQEAVIRGLSNLDQFEPGTSMQAWLFTILRNQFHTAYRKKRREIEDPDGALAGTLVTLPEQHGRLDVADLQAALAKLPVYHREVLVLVGAEGLSYEDTARIVGVSVGTVKSRLHRARLSLAELLHIHDETDLGSDCVIRAALGAEGTRQGAVQEAA
jgi:RNA polymerase sigma-70 factor (ECF subfamily)